MQNLLSKWFSRTTAIALLLFQLSCSDQSTVTSLSSPLLGKPLPFRDDFHNLRFTLQTIETQLGDGILLIEEDPLWILIQARVENQGQQTHLLTAAMFALVDDEGTIYPSSNILRQEINETTKNLDAELEGGGKISGAIAFAVPPTAQDLKLVFNPNYLICPLPSAPANGFNCNSLTITLQ